MSSSGNRARSVDAKSDGASSHQPSTIQKGTVRSGVDTPASLSSSSESHGSVGGGLRAHPHLYDESHAESVRNIDTSPHASLVTAADLASCLAENAVRPAGYEPNGEEHDPVPPSMGQTASHHGEDTTMSHTVEADETTFTVSSDRSVGNRIEEDVPIDIMKLDDDVLELAGLPPPNGFLREFFMKAGYRLTFSARSDGRMSIQMKGTNGRFVSHDAVYRDIYNRAGGNVDESHRGLTTPYEIINLDTTRVHEHFHGVIGAPLFEERLVTCLFRTWKARCTHGNTRRSIPPADQGGQQADRTAHATPVTSRPAPFVEPGLAAGHASSKPNDGLRYDGEEPLAEPQLSGDVGIGGEAIPRDRANLPSTESASRTSPSRFHIATGDSTSGGSGVGVG